MDKVSSLFIINNCVNLYQIYLDEEKKEGSGVLFIDCAENNESKAYVKYFNYEKINALVKDEIEKSKSYRYKHILTSKELDKSYPKKDDMYMILYNGKEQFVMNVKIEKYNNNGHIVFYFATNKTEKLYNSGWKVYYEGFYELLENANKSDDVFNDLRSNDLFNIIYQEGDKEYGDAIIKKLNLCDEDMEIYNDFDSMMNPNTHNYSVGTYSTGLLRYINTYHDIFDTLMKNCDMKMSSIDSIVEIGSGYGGLCKVIKSDLKEVNYTVLDLGLITNIAKVFLDGVKGIKFDDTGGKYDLCISEYGLCELSDKKLEEYLKLLSRCSMCFLKMNIWDEVEKEKFKLKLKPYFKNMIELVETPKKSYPDYVLFLY